MVVAKIVEADAWKPVDGQPKQPASLTHEFTRMDPDMVHPKVVQERLGHSTIAVTMDIYSHVTQTMQSEAVAKLDLAFGDHFGDQSQNDAQAAE